MPIWKAGLIGLMVLVDIYIVIFVSTPCDDQRVFMYFYAALLQVIAVSILVNTKLYFNIVNNIKWLRKGLFILPIIIVGLSFHTVWQAKTGIQVIAGQKYCSLE